MFLCFIKSKSFLFFFFFFFFLNTRAFEFIFSLDVKSSLKKNQIVKVDVKASRSLHFLSFKLQQFELSTIFHHVFASVIFFIALCVNTFCVILIMLYWFFYGKFSMCIIAYWITYLLFFFITIFVELWNITIFKIALASVILKSEYDREIKSH